MPNRFNARGKTNKGQQPLPTGYPDAGVTSDFVVPSVGLEDVDSAIFNLFDKEIPIQIDETSSSGMKKVPVIFAGGEKWAMLKRNKPLRDKSNTLILPLITIGRAGFSQTSTEDLVGRGINQKTGEIVISRRLDKSDRGYQNLINRTSLQGQQNLAVTPIDAFMGQLSTKGNIGDFSEDPTVRSGGLISGRKSNIGNVYETIVIPSPQFITVTYDVIVWTQYTHHMNQVIETIISSYLPQTQGWRLDTPKGYWFIANVDDGSFATETNFEDMSQGERIIKQKFSVKVPAFILASSAPGVPIAAKKYVSVASVSFDVGLTGKSVSANKSPVQQDPPVDDPFLGSDDPTLPTAENARRGRSSDQRKYDNLRPFTGGEIEDSDPALSSFPRGTKPGMYTKFVSTDAAGKQSTQYIRIVNKNPFTGETTYAPGVDLAGLTITAIEE